MNLKKKPGLLTMSESSDILRRPQKFIASSTYNLAVLKVNKKWKMGEISAAFSESLNCNLTFARGVSGMLWGNPMTYRIFD